MTDVFEALAAEYAAIESMLAGLEDADWQRPSLCDGWTVCDVVLHLAQTAELVGVDADRQAEAVSAFPSANTIDEAVEQWVRRERGASGAEVFERWRKAVSSAIDVLRNAGPEDRFAWATVPLKARTLATTRLSEHWIHANDIAQPLGISFPDTERLWHIARLAHRTIPYAFSLAQRPEPPVVRMTVTAPDGATWTFGDDDAPCAISGHASEICRIAARRLSPADAHTLEASGDRVDEVLELIRTYA